MDEQTQKTQPKEGEPIEIPTPTRRQVFGDLEKLAKAKPKGSTPDRPKK